MSPLDDIRALEKRALKAWPALDSQTAEGWIQRRSGGYTKRANSINALEVNGPLTLEMKDALEAPYTAANLPPVWRLTPLAPAGADDLLAQAGDRRAEG